MYGILPLLTLKWHTSPAITIIGPPEMKEFIDRTISMCFMPKPRFKLKYIEVPDGSEMIVLEEKTSKGHFTVKAVPLDHNPASHGFVISSTCRKLKYEKAVEAGISHKNFKDILSGSFAEIRSIDSQGKETVHKVDEFVELNTEKIAILGDTKFPSSHILESLKDCDLAVMECTFGAKDKDFAPKFNHLSSFDVSKIITFCKLKHVILTHFSHIYTDSETPRSNFSIKPNIVKRYERIQDELERKSDQGSSECVKDDSKSIQDASIVDISPVMRLKDEVLSFIKEECVVDCAFDGMRLEKDWKQKRSGRKGEESRQYFQRNTWKNKQVGRLSVSRLTPMKIASDSTSKRSTKFPLSPGFASSHPLSHPMMKANPLSFTRKGSISSARSGSTSLNLSTSGSTLSIAQISSNSPSHRLNRVVVSEDLPSSLATLVTSLYLQTPREKMTLILRMLHAMLSSDSIMMCGCHVALQLIDEDDLIVKRS
ncbi:hypothetical protein ADUPG1_000192, partial [Aduncisulcus paluster]